jgi:hypothetical protein
MKYLLIAAWFIAGQPPVPFQAEFGSQLACQKAVGDLALAFSSKMAKGELLAVCVER